LFSIVAAGSAFVFNVILKNIMADLGVKTAAFVTNNFLREDNDF